jgi:uracil-DNA glycosylase
MEKMNDCRICADQGYTCHAPAVISPNPDAKIFLIGQAPGITEWETGRPFNGQAGRRLFQWLAQAGIEEAWFRSTQYISQAYRCYPGKTQTGDRKPSVKELKNCRLFLDEEIALIQPKLIIPVGRLAMEVFYPNKIKLDEVIGTQITHNGVSIVPLPHPSGLNRWLHKPENKTLTEQALNLIGEVVKEIQP